MVLGIDLKSYFTETLSNYNNEICSEYTKLVTHTCDHGNKEGAGKEQKGCCKNKSSLQQNYNKNEALIKAILLVTDVR